MSAAITEDAFAYTQQAAPVTHRSRRGGAGRNRNRHNELNAAASYGEMSNMGGTSRGDEKRGKKVLNAAEIPVLKKSTSGGSALSGYANSAGAYHSQGAGKKQTGAKAAFGVPEEINERQVRQALADEKRRIMKAMEQQQE